MEIDYSNVKKLPLNQLTLDAKNDGIKLQIPALDKRWITDRPHTKYFPLLIDAFKLNDSNARKEWITVNEWFNQELEWLLGLKHHVFWSCLVFDSGCMSSILSFLQEATPAYINIEELTNDIQILNLYRSIMRNVLTVLCRIVTNKESETEWITKEHLADLLYSKFLISIPLILDVLVAFGPDNATVINRWINTIFSIQPKYKNDLTEALTMIGKTFDVIKSNINKNEDKTLNDLALFAMDCSFTLHTLVIIIPEAIEMCEEIHLERLVTAFYDEAFPFLSKNIAVMNSNTESLKYVNLARIELIEFFREIIKKHLKVVLHDANNRLESAEKIIGFLQEVLSDHCFMVDYHKMYPVQDDMNILQQASMEIDTYKIKFVVEAFTAPIKNFEEEINQNFGKASADVVEPSTSKPIDIIDKNVQSVLDVLPHLEPQFVEKLLTRYEDTESAIAAILEGNLPPDLDESVQLDFDSPKHTSIPDVAGATELMSNIDLIENSSRIITKEAKSKHIRSREEKKILNEKDHLRDQQSRYVSYSYISDNEYDDEYDDSYDAITESETKSTVKNLKSTGALNYVMDDIDDDESSESETENTRDASKDFCVNPEVMRERWAQNRQAKFQSKITQAPKPKSDVIGKPKGQGQDKSVLINRNKKEANKSSRANHNRRQGAAFKRNRGMIPS